MAYSKKQVEDLFARIIQRIESGTESVRTILKDKDLPGSETFYKWLAKDEEKAKQYARATKIRADNIFDEMFDIADNSENDYMNKVVAGEVTRVLDPENIQRSRLRIDTRKWGLSKLNPKKYGDKLDMTSGGEKIESQKIELIYNNAKIDLKE